MARITRRLSPSMVIALIALFVSMGGVSYGLATGSIDSREIKNKTIRDKDVKTNAIRSGLGPNSVQGDEIVNGSIRGVDVGDQQLGDAQIREAELDVVRLAGQPASAYVKNPFQVPRASANNSSTPQPATATCPAGTRLLGGGARTTGADGLAIADSGPASANSWTVESREIDPVAGNHQTIAIAICG